MKNSITFKGFFLLKPFLNKIYCVIFNLDGRISDTSIFFVFIYLIYNLSDVLQTPGFQNNLFIRSATLTVAVTIQVLTWAPCTEIN